MSLNDTPCVSCGRCAETCPTGALMPKPRVLQKYDVDESRCILCGICVDACPYDALRDGGDFELSHTSRVDPMVDLIALAAVDRETEMTYIRRERDWAERAAAAGRPVTPTRLLPMLPAAIAAQVRGGRERPRQRPCRRQRPRTGADGRPRDIGARARIRRVRPGRSRARLSPSRCPSPTRSRSSASPGTTSCSSSSPGRCSLSAARGRDAARHHPLRPRDDGLLRRPRRDLRDGRRAARRRRPGPRLHRRDQRPDPVRDHAHPDEGGAGPARLPDAGRARGDRGGGPRRRPRPDDRGDPVGRHRPADGDRHERARRASSSPTGSCRSRSSACCCSRR